MGVINSTYLVLRLGVAVIKRLYRMPNLVNIRRTTYIRQLKAHSTTAANVPGIVSCIMLFYTNYKYQLREFLSFYTSCNMGIKFVLSLCAISYLT